MDDFVELESVPLDLSSDPEVEDIFSVGVKDFRDTPGVEYPAIVLSDVLFLDALRILQAYKRDSFRTCHMWLEMQESGDFQNIGSLQLTSDVLLVLRHLRIRVTVYWDADNIEVLDLDNPEILEKLL